MRIACFGDRVERYASISVRWLATVCLSEVEHLELRATESFVGCGDRLGGLFRYYYREAS